MAKILRSDDDFKLLQDKTVSVIFDGFINGLGIARSLNRGKNLTIVVVSKKGSPLSHSNCIDYQIEANNQEELEEVIFRLNSIVGQAIPYFCSDLNLKTIIENASELQNYSIYPFDLNLLNKDAQLRICNSADVTTPISIILNNSNEVAQLKSFGTEYIVKPISSKPTNPFKTKISSDIEVMKKYSLQCIKSGNAALVSQYIPGDDSHLLTLGGYSYKGELMMPFTGRKLAQRPKSNGVASLAETLDSDACLIELGSRFLKEANYTGIFQIEFKVDNDDNYYFIEFNPRNWAWGYVATMSGKNLPLIKYEKESNPDSQAIIQNSEIRHNFYFWAEGVGYNLIIDRWLGVIPKFFSMLFSRKKITFAIFSFKDSKPFFIYLKNLILFSLKLRKHHR